MGRIQEFEQELRRRSKPAFGQWRKLDLHNHTPKSFDYKYSGGDLARLLSNRIVEADLGAVMFTDHEVLPQQSLIDTLTKDTGRLVLRGVELNVFVDALDFATSKVGDHCYYHILVGFDPEGSSAPEYWLEELYRECGSTEREVGGRRLRGITASPERLSAVLAGANAIVIPAHLHTVSDPARSRSIDDIYSDPTFLRHAKDAFTAVEVTQLSTAAFFDGEHDETNRLLKTCIRSSDSHEPAALGTRVAYAQIENLSYADVKAALELPFRVSLSQPAQPGGFISGVRIRGAFFPDLWLQFSPHCNMFIAVKGSGKTAVLECLRFALGAEVPRSRSAEVGSHLSRILGASGRVEVLVQRPDGARLLIERAVGQAEFNVHFEDGRNERLSSADGLRFPIQILGWHEIEHAATDANIRRSYLDAIAGPAQIRLLEANAEATAGRIRERHVFAAQRYAVYRDTQDRIARLRDLRKGLQELTDAALIELRDQFQLATEQREALDRAIHQLSSAATSPIVLTGAMPSRDAIGSAQSPLRDPLNQAIAALNNLHQELANRSGDVQRAISECALSLSLVKSDVDGLYERFLDSYSGRVADLLPTQRALLESHREAIEQTKALSNLEAEANALKDEIRSALGRLASLCEEVTGILDERTRIRQSAVERLNSALLPQGVRLTLLAQQSSPEYAALGSQYARGAQALTQIRTRLSDRSAHLSLMRAYRGLLTGLDADFSVFLFDSELSYLLSAFENDDLRIELRAGRAGQEFTAIDKLSAGQRCTAVFPMLLRLEQGPLVVDQPEDNLDNRHIATSIAPALLSHKRSRQMIFTSHNANLVVLSDAESIVLYESDGSTGRVESQGFFAHRASAIAPHVIDVLDGGENALHLRAIKYGIRRT